MATIKKRGTAQKQREQEIVSIAHTVSRFLSQYQKQLSIGAVVIAAVVIVSGGYSIVRQRQEQKASPLVASAYAVYQPANGPADYQKALELFRQVQKQYPSTESGAVALYYAGNCLVHLNRTEDAIKDYDTFVKRYSGRTFLLGLVYQRMGFAYKELGKLEDARKAFEQSETADGPGIATYELARLYETAGNLAEAQKKWKEIADKLQGTSWSVEAVGKVQKIEPVPAQKSGAKTK